ncbi:hypothetical protein Tco_1254132 [Tanacetum coccineum]
MSRRMKPYLWIQGQTLRLHLLALPWRRAIEIGLSTKRKLGFVRGTVVRSPTDDNLQKLWDTCNNMAISWIMGSVSDSIARSIMFIGTASEIWQQLERRFFLSDDSRKYKLNKDTYEITQSGCSVGEYYTKMKCVWEELGNLNTLPVIATITPEITAFLNVLSKQKEEQRLFQFLNGLEDKKNPKGCCLVQCPMLRQQLCIVMWSS